MATTSEQYINGRDQILKSKADIEAWKKHSYDKILDIKLNNEKEEKVRRDQEEMQRHKRYTDLQNEATESSKRNFALELKWSELRGIDECETLYKEIMKQKEAFEQILKAKNNLIESFTKDLKKKDEDYVKMLNSQNDDVDSIIEQMMDQFKKLRKMYLHQLNEIEKALETDRAELLSQRKTTIDRHMSDHLNTEKQIITNRLEEEKKNAAEIEKIRIDHAKSYADKKINMETEIQNLEKCLEDMKALYLLNSEKLDYNFKVLKEKDDENTHQTGILKKKKRNHLDRLRKASKDYNDIDGKFKQENKQLTEEYKRITKQFKELQNKFKHFEKADLERYNEIQKMNEAEVHELKDKLLKCDKTIHLQQLGMQWSAPVDENTSGVNETKDEMSKMQHSASGSGKKDTVEDEEDFNFGTPSSEMQILTEILIRETDFLLDEKTRDKLATIDDYVEMRKIKLETIKKSLSLDSVEEMDLLYTHLFKYVKIQKRIFNDDEGEEEEEGDEEDYEEEDAHNPYDDDGTEIEYDPDLLVNALIKFMKDKDQRKKELESQHAKKAITKETEREKKERIAREGKKYWEKLTHVLPEHTLRIWKVLDKALSKYYTLLVERQKLIEETGDLHNQNEELKNLLNQYFQINHELLIPPTKMIQFEASQNNQ